MNDDRHALVRRRHRGLSVGLVLALAALALPGVAGAAGTLDQQQTSTASGVLAVEKEHTPAQAFTAGRSGRLTHVELPLYFPFCPNPVPRLTITIRPLGSDGSPSADILADASVPERCTPDLEWKTVAFASPARVRAGLRYAIVATSDGVFSGGTWFWGFREADPYPGGAAWQHTAAGWTEHSSDMAFKTYVEPAVEARFLAPLDQSTDAGTVVNTAKNGRVVAVRVQLATDGIAITDANAPGPVTIQMTKLAACEADVASDPVEVYAAGSTNSGSAFRYDLASQAWVYNLDTKAMGLTSGDCYRIAAVVDGVEASNAWAIVSPVR
jgi:hypothetical protein